MKSLKSHQLLMTMKMNLINYTIGVIKILFYIFQDISLNSTPSQLPYHQEFLTFKDILLFYMFHL